MGTYREGACRAAIWSGFRQVQCLLDGSRGSETGTTPKPFVEQLEPRRRIVWR